MTGRFEPGRTPFNKGKKKDWAGGEATQFKKGHKPHNYVPVGSERINGDDYVDVKIADPNKWRGKHQLVWEKNNGPIPKGYVIIFGDGNRRNFDPNNLILISRGQLAIMNKNGLIQNNADLTRTGIIMADIYRKIGERKRSKRRGRRSTDSKGYFEEGVSTE
nr:HNH endonuclease signature motif containing protein [Paenibacillus periandrae]